MSGTLIKSALVTWDFTLPESAVESHEEIITKLKEFCKSWAFQLEEGEATGYKHYQGRFSLKIKARFNRCKELIGFDKIHLSPTSKNNQKNNFYVTKEETRIAGPWVDKDEATPYIPRQVRECPNLLPWQQAIIDDKEVWNTRIVNIVYDDKGNTGKTIIALHILAHKIGFALPYCNDLQAIMRSIYDVPTQKLYVMDMPRAINKEKQFQLFSGIECLKNGYCYDDRYHFKYKIFDCPNIWMFTNSMPDRNLLSRDRWRIWHVVDTHLVLMTEEEILKARKERPMEEEKQFN